MKQDIGATEPVTKQESAPVAQRCFDMTDLTGEVLAGAIHRQWRLSINFRQIAVPPDDVEAGSVNLHDDE